MIYSSKQRTKSGSHRLAVMTVNGTTKMVKIPAECNGTIHLDENSIRRVWKLSPSEPIKIG